jgi:hypothetical protein
MENELIQATQEAATPAGDQPQGSEQEQQSGHQSSSETGAEQNSEQQQVEVESTEKVEPAKKDKKGTPWYQHRINELTRERKVSDERAQHETAERTRIQEAYEALQRGETKPETQPGNQSQSEIERQVAERIESAQRAKSFNDDCNKVFQAGSDEYQNFGAVLSQFSLLGEIPPHFLEAATMLDGGHKVLYHLGQNLDEAAEILTLPPVKLALKMAEIKSQLDKPIQKPVSRTPAPIKPIDGSGKGEVDLSKSSLDDFMERRNRDAPVKR